ncbi:sugar phosphate isomerase/epimerase [Chloroflexi bacterium TSY]|nr:sugar phosphate isomerase/epimerase [Chloroflexi bacterium TSY]
MTNHQLKLGMYLPELGLPFDEALATAKDIGANYVWFNRLGDDEPAIGQLSDAEVDRLGERVSRHGLEIFLLNVGNPFKQIHLTDIDIESMTEHSVFRQEMDDLIRSMQIAARLGIGAVGAFTFAWPGEYTAGKPTWPMRWLTRGGHIADVDMKKLVKAFSLAAEHAERFDVDLVLSMMPWNYTNTTGNFRRLAEAVGSQRIKVMWGPADNLNCGELDVATVGFHNIKPYLHGLHLKDLHVINGLQCEFEYCPIGEGDVDYVTVLRNLHDHHCDVFLSVATHFLPPSGSREEAMRTNVAKLKAFIHQVANG